MLDWQFINEHIFHEVNRRTVSTGVLCTWLEKQCGTWKTHHMFDSTVQKQTLTSLDIAWICSIRQTTSNLRLCPVTLTKYGWDCIIITNYLGSGTLLTRLLKTHDFAYDILIDPEKRINSRYLSISASISMRRCWLMFDILATFCPKNLLYCLCLWNAFFSFVSRFSNPVCYEINHLW